MLASTTPGIGQYVTEVRDKNVNHSDLTKKSKKSSQKNVLNIWLCQPPPPLVCANMELMTRWTHGLHTHIAMHSAER